jgi:hypothetical protein
MGIDRRLPVSPVGPGSWHAARPKVNLARRRCGSFGNVSRRQSVRFTHRSIARLGSANQRASLENIGDSFRPFSHIIMGLVLIGDLGTDHNYAGTSSDRSPDLGGSRCV